MSHKKMFIATSGAVVFLVLLVANQGPSGSEASAPATEPAERAAVVPVGPAPTQVIPRTQLVRAALSYLDEVPEVAWYEVADNDVYVGFAPLPQDWEGVIRGAALRCNRAIDFGCHVWAVAADQKGWRPGNSSYYGEATARHGRIER